MMEHNEMRLHVVHVALSDGYHIINFGATEKKFEIYCQNKKII